MSTTTTAEGNPATFDPATASLDDLRAQLDAPNDMDVVAAEEIGTPAETPAAQAPEETPATPPEAEATQPPEPEAPEAPTPAQPPEAEEDVLKKMRIRPRAKEDMQVMDLYRSEGFEGTFQDAVNIIYGVRTPPATEADARTQPAEAPEPEVPAELTTLQTEIAEIEEQLNKATDEFDAAAAMKLHRELMRKELAASKITDRLEAQKEARLQTADDTRRQQAAESRTRAVEKYPDLQDKDSINRKRFDAFLVEAQRDPVQAPIFQSPLWPEILADRFAAKHGVKPAAPVASPASPSASPVRPATGTHVRQVSSGTRTGEPQPQATEATLRRDMKNLTKEELDAMLATPT